MPDPAPSKPSAPRIAETAAGKALMALLALFYALLATAAAGGEWHTLFLPACLLAAALLLFCFCILRGYKIPRPGLPGAGAGRRLFPPAGVVFTLVLL